MSLYAHKYIPLWIRLPYAPRDEVAGSPTSCGDIGFDSPIKTNTILTNSVAEGQPQKSPWHCAQEDLSPSCYTHQKYKRRFKLNR
jgi:hypothetical protein